MFGTQFILIALHHPCDVIGLGSIHGAHVHSLEPCLHDGAGLAWPLGVSLHLAAPMYTLYSRAYWIVNYYVPGNLLPGHLNT